MAVSIDLKPQENRAALAERAVMSAPAFPAQPLDEKPSLIGLSREELGEALASVGAWADAGATHLSINTMGAGLRSVDEHLAVLARLAEGI